MSSLNDSISAKMAVPTDLFHGFMDVLLTGPDSHLCECLLL